MAQNPGHLSHFKGTFHLPASQSLGIMSKSRNCGRKTSRNLEKQLFFSANVDVEGHHHKGLQSSLQVLPLDERRPTLRRHVFIHSDACRRVVVEGRQDVVDVWDHDVLHNRALGRQVLPQSSLDKNAAPPQLLLVLRAIEQAVVDLGQHFSI